MKRIFATSISAAALALAGCSDGGPLGFAAHYELIAVRPEHYVPLTGPGIKYLSGGCLTLNGSREAIVSVVSTRESQLGAKDGRTVRETDRFGYRVDGITILLEGIDTARETSIGISTDTQVLFVRTLQNEGLPVARTLIFRKLPPGSSTFCNS